jgi:N-acetylglutamate synthase-like GNAT family acetyltransferase
MTVVALSDETLLGSASLIAHDMDTRMDLSPWLASVYVTPAYRDRGLGSTLVRRIASEAATLGFERLYLFTPDRERFYARLGWTVLERTVYRGYDQVVMVLRTTSGQSAESR